MCRVCWLIMQGEWRVLGKGSGVGGGGGSRGSRGRSG